MGSIEAIRSGSVDASTNGGIGEENMAGTSDGGYIGHHGRFFRIEREAYEAKEPPKQLPLNVQPLGFCWR
jgi:hypothetical protein